MKSEEEINEKLNRMTIFRTFDPESEINWEEEWINRGIELGLEWVLGEEEINDGRANNTETL
jgi:hypothetical protein